jgi:protein gp37
VTRIPYLDEMWSVATGCGDDMVSPGCENCYARRMFGRNLWKCPACGGLGEMHQVSKAYPGAVWTFDCQACHGTGHADFTPTFHADRLEQPLHWRKPRRIGVSFMGDLFHEGITDEQILSVLNVVRRDWNRSFEGQTPHTFMVLTKRPGRMHDIALRARLDNSGTRGMYLDDKASDHTGYPILGHHGATGLPNLWLGVTICNQAEADATIPILLATPAAKRWVSLEPMLGPVDLEVGHGQGVGELLLDGLDWVVLGGETGPGARPMQPEWALGVFRQCKAAGVAFWWKAGSKGFSYDPKMTATRELPS